MAYSTIKIKVGRCLDCEDGSPDKPLTAKRCPYHYQKHRAGIHSRAQKKYRLINVRDQSGLSPAEINLWFAEREKELAAKPYCIECGEWIPLEFRRHAVSHIFPKSIFKSIRTHRWNYLFLGAGCGCHDKSHTIESFKKLKCFPIAIQRYMMFKDEIKENHKYLNLFEEQVELFQAYLL